MLDESPEGHQVCQRLCSLEVCPPYRSTEDADLFFVLRRLTNLTKLALDVDPNSVNLFIEPFTELEKIEDLHAPGMVTNSVGQLMFPSLTNLTHLLFDESIDKPQPYNYGVLEVNLQSLSFNSHVAIC